MKSIKNQHVFKYDKHNNLYAYVESDYNGNLLSLYTFNYKNNSMIRYDKLNQLRFFTQYDEPCKMIQKFDSGESWIKCIPINNNFYIYNNPKIKKQFAINNDNQIVKFSFQQHLMIDY